MKLRTIKEHNDEVFDAVHNNKDGLGTRVECPHCGSELIYANPHIVLCSYPPQKRVECKSCGYSTSIFVRS